MPIQYNDLDLAFRFASFVGILPFTKDGKFSKALWLRSVCLLLYLVLTVFPVEIYEYVMKLPKRKDLMKLMMSTMFVLHRPVAFVTVSLHVYNSYKYRKMIGNVLTYLRRFKAQTNNRITVFILIWIFASDVNFMYFRSGLKTWADVSKWARRVSMFLIFFLNTFVVSLYSGFLFYLEKRLLAARSAIKTSIGYVILEHAYILHLCQIIDSCFGPSLLILMLDSSYSVISTGYFITSLFFSSEYLSYNKISEKAFFAVILVYLIYYPATKCEKVKNAAAAFNNELFKVMQHSTTLCRNKKLELYVTMKTTVDFTAFGFFSLGYPLITSIVAAATAYLVVLIDFSLVV